MSCLNGHDSVQRTMNARTSEAEGGESVVVGSTNASAVESPEEGGGEGGAPEEDFTLRRLELARI